MKRVVLVTGGSSGLGRTVAARFRSAGDRVVIAGRSRERLTDVAVALDVEQIPCDATDARQVAQLADQLGPELDVLVNMAGANTDFEPDGRAGTALERTARAWRANLDTNLLSAVLTTTAVLDKMRPGGSIINIGSIGAEYAATSYGAAKAAVAAWTAGLSAEVGRRGLTANVVSPGYIDGTDFFRGRLSSQRRTALIEATHNGRPGQPGDIAATIFFLASDGARHVTGQTLHVNGGAHTTR